MKVRIKMLKNSKNCITRGYYRECNNPMKLNISNKLSGDPILISNLRKEVSI